MLAEAPGLPVGLTGCVAGGEGGTGGRAGSARTGLGTAGRVSRGPPSARRRRVGSVGPGAEGLSWPWACRPGREQGGLAPEGAGQLTIGVHVVTWHLGWREALLEGVAAAVGALLHGHDLLLRRGQRCVGGHHALHAARQDLWGQRAPSPTGPARPVPGAPTDGPRELPEPSHMSSGPQQPLRPSPDFYKDTLTPCSPPGPTGLPSPVSEASYP